ncbi:NUDIX domain-containing protein [Streptomyces sp. NPDC097619]|uniref:NUDIX domain-containing protein n=1 Tax=Streptomyces sp. NPDC097619 TaxID=3157228 RepID=UPI00331DC295
MSSVKLRHSVRAIVLDEEDRILLCRFSFPDRAVWSVPGGGVEPGEERYAALRREMREETGLRVTGEPPHVWRRRVLDPGYAEGYDGVLMDYFLVRAAAFRPAGSLSTEELAAENITGFRWWRPEEITGYRGPDLFGPRALGELLTGLLRDGAPARPLELDR